MLSAYGHSWIDNRNAEQASEFVAERVSRQLGSTINNCGVGGSLSGETAALVTENPPSPSNIFLLMTGLNDARIFGRSRQPLANYADALHAIFTAFHVANPNTQVVVLQQPYLLDYSHHAPANLGSDDIIDSYNEVLTREAADTSSVTVADVTGWNRHTMIDDDAVHPNCSGHAHLADVVINALEGN